MTLKNVQLFSGAFTDTIPTEAESDTVLEKEALLVYPGKFSAMSGEIEVTDEHIEKLVSNHNSLFAKVKRLASGDVPLRDCPPLQLDHQMSASATVGRVIGELSRKPVDIDGKVLMGVFGKVRVLGKENVEKVRDGRWIHLSVGADFEDGKLNELTITPFPAAAQASMLSRLMWVSTQGGGLRKVAKAGKSMYSCSVYKVAASEWAWCVWEGEEFGPMVNMGIVGSEEEGKNQCDNVLIQKMATATLSAAKLGKDWDVKFIEYKGNKIYIWEEARTWDADKKTVVYGAYVGNWGQGTKVAGEYESHDAALKGAKEFIDMGNAKLSEEQKEELNMDKEKLKKRLMDTTKCSEKEAEEKLASMSDEDQQKLWGEVQEDEKKLSEEEEKKKSEEKLAKKTAFIKLSKDFRKGAADVQLTAKTAKLSARLASLRSNAKISPAEIKKIDIARLAKQSDATIDAVMKSYEDREPVILVGQLGSVKSEDISRLAKNQKLREERDASLQNMPFTKAALAASGKEEKNEGAKELESPEKTESLHDKEGQVTDESDQLTDVDKMMDAYDQRMSEGKKDEARDIMRAYFKKMSGNTSSEATPVSEEQQKQMSALAEQVKTLQNNFDEVLKLAGPALGIEDSDLK